MIRFGVTANDVRNWENGSDEPTIRQLERLSRIYVKALAFFFRPEPPPIPPRPPDLRILPELGEGNFSIGTQKAFRHTRRIQFFMDQLLEATGEEPAKIPLPSDSIRRDPEKLAEHVRRDLDVSVREQGSWRRPSDALNEWTSIIEGYGALVLRISMPVNDVLGFSITDENFPVVAINSRDPWERRQIFTLMHELGHLMLRRTGVCDWTHGDRENLLGIELFCNRFASAVLMPSHAILEHPRVKGFSDEWDDLALDAIAKTFVVSKESVLLRLISLKLAPWGLYDVKKPLWQHEFAELQERLRLKRFVPRPNPARKALREHGNRFASVVLDAHARGVINAIDVARYLGVKNQHVPELRRIIKPLA